VSCPRTAIALGTQPSLRAAKRFVVMHELRDFSARRKRERINRQLRTA
jgi:predicted ABC-class ATPase